MRCRRSWRSHQKWGLEFFARLWSSPCAFFPAVGSAWCKGQRSATARQLESDHGLPRKVKTIKYLRLYVLKISITLNVLKIILNIYSTLIWTMNAFLSSWYSREKWRVPSPASLSSPWGLSTAGVGAWLERVLDGEGRSRRSITPGWVNPAWGEGSSRSGELRSFWWWWNGLVVKLPFRSRFSRSRWRVGLEPFGLDASLSVPAAFTGGAVWQFPLTSVLLVSLAAVVGGAANFFLPLRLSG